MGSQFTEGNGRAVNITAWRKKGGSVWNYCRDVIKQKKEEDDGLDGNFPIRAFLIQGFAR
ncbi:MAG TPA: hypothetical protein DEB74_01005 [Lachnospiraceae bacterium]|jgi:hypothetical protein|nr:hypothetical protein [Lachnospiraceae bacterium]